MVADPVRVAIIDYGYHASLAVPDSSGGVTEYAFGEWGWYVENRTGWWRVPGVLAFPRRGALGRHRLSCDLDTLANETGAEAVLVVRVEREKLEAWQGSMVEAWDRGSLETGVVLNPVHGMEFVACRDDYWAFHTCNAAVAAWLEELGCEIDGPTVSADFRVVQPAGPATRGED